MVMRITLINQMAEYLRDKISDSIVRKLVKMDELILLLESTSTQSNKEEVVTLLKPPLVLP